MTAAAIAAYELKIAVDNINVKAVGGDLKVSFSKMMTEFIRKFG